MEKKNGLDSSLYTRRDFLGRVTAASGAAVISRVAAPGMPTAAADRTPSAERLFPEGLPELAWSEFSAQGFEGPVSGVIYRPAKAPCCGCPLGGISTDCIDVNVDSVYGYSSLFNPVSPCPIAEGMRMPRKAPSFQPLLGLSMQGRTTVLTTQKVLQGGEISACLDPFFGKSYLKEIKVPITRLEGVSSAREISYWGHYPVVDIEYATDLLVAVGLRAWAPFIPGDVAASNIPAAIFEVHLRVLLGNASKARLRSTFPGRTLRKRAPWISDGGRSARSFAG